VEGLGHVTVARALEELVDFGDLPGEAGPDRGEHARGEHARGEHARDSEDEIELAVDALSAISDAFASGP
jgi:hypothetical protein